MGSGLLRRTLCAHEKALKDQLYAFNVIAAYITNTDHFENQYEFLKDLRCLITHNEVLNGCNLNQGPETTASPLSCDGQAGISNAKLVPVFTGLK